MPNPETNRKSFLSSNKAVQVILRYGLMILIAFLLFGVILLISGKNPLLSFRDLFTSTLGSTYGFSEVIVAMIPILLTALAVALPSRIGMINVGAEGQLYLGGIAATFAALAFNKLPAGLLLPLMVIFGMTGGGTLGTLASLFPLHRISQ